MPPNETPSLDDPFDDGPLNSVRSRRPSIDSLPIQRPLLASSTSIALDEYPENPPGIWDSEEHNPLASDPSKNTVTMKETKKAKLSSSLAPQESTVEPKQSVRMRLPESSDVKQISPTAPSYSRHIHTRDPSDLGPGSSAFNSPTNTDYEDGSDEYDWSGEEDLVEESNKFVENNMGKKQKQTGYGPKRLFVLAFSSLVGSTLMAALVATPAIIVHFYWYLPNPTDRRKFVNQNVQAWIFWVAANIVISWYLAMIIDIIPILVQYIITVTWGHLSENVKSKAEMYDAVKGTIKPAFYGASALVSWVVIFSHIYGLYNIDDAETSRAAYTDRVFQVVLFFFFFSLVLCVQKMLSHYVAWNFHHTAYEDRIEEVEKCLKVVERLRQYKPKKVHCKTGSGARTPMYANRLSDGFLPHDLNAVNTRLRAMHPISRLASEVSNSTKCANDADIEDAEKSLVGTTPKAKKKSRFWFKRKEKSVDNIVLDDLANERDVFDYPPASSRFGTSMALDGRTSDSTPMTTRPSSPAVKEHIHNATPTQIGDKSNKKHRTEASQGTLSQAAKVLKNAVLHDARNIKGANQDMSGLVWDVSSTAEAKHLARMLFQRLRDRRRKYLIPSDFYPVFATEDEADDAFSVFDKDHNGDLSRTELKATLVKTYRERRFLSRSLKDAGEALRTLDRILLVFALVILFFISLSVFGVEVGNSLSSVYTVGIAASFIFKSSASRAFDAIMFLFVTHPYDTGDRVFVDNDNLIVKKMGLFATVFTRSDGTETYYFNSQLFNKFITNVRRSGKTTEMLPMQVAWKTPLTKLDALEKNLNDWLSTEENRWFRPETGVTLQHIVYQRYLELTIGIAHNGNWQDWGLRNARKTAFHAAVQYYCRKLGIVGYESLLPVVYAEPDTNSSPIHDLDEDGEGDMISPNTESQFKEEIDNAAKNEAPSLGFLPPLPERSQLARARKSHRSKKHKLGAMNAEC
ncbi:hypothetical protein FA15DRAFT_664267 [Coprinopsis marcescibilis]|uniref:EF-hand domain-containing protein n=1 Tax=Coprinopsis marcescibilis TaxID=230819 RepID=A0A5C3L8H7_COPMA|nr:hypothetical protein FA15DRAFT_664267 [Coprinopsis marcescibilis]